MQRITDRATQHLSEAWSNLTPVTFKVEDFESNPQLVQIVPPNETVVVVGFELKMGNRAGTMSLCIPYNVIEPIMGVLAAQNWFSYQRKGGQEDHLRKLTRNVQQRAGRDAGVPGADDDQLNDLLSLQVGDVITTEKAIERDVLIQVEGKNKFLGQIGQFRGQPVDPRSRGCASEARAAEAADERARGGQAMTPGRRRRRAIAAAASAGRRASARSRRRAIWQRPSCR